MSNKFFLLVTFLVLLSFYSPSTYPIEGGTDATELTKKVETDNLSGFNLWIAELYNTDKVKYAIIVTFVMGFVGTTIAFGTDIILKMMGLDVSKISHHE